MSDPMPPASDRLPAALEGNVSFAARGAPEASYDFFKHLTTINLASIGGIFGLLKGDDIEISASGVLAIVACLSASGLLSVACLSQIARGIWDADGKGGDVLP